MSPRHPPSTARLHVRTTMVLDLALVVLAAIPVFHRLATLNVPGKLVYLETLVPTSFTTAATDARLWLALLGIGVNYLFHAFVWYCPQRFAAFCSSAPLRCAPTPSDPAVCLLSPDGPCRGALTAAAGGWAADRWLGAHPVSVFAKLEVAFKLSQLGVLWLYLGDGGRAAALASVQSAPAWCWQVGVALILVGQTLNLAIYRAIGNDGVYYGFKLGRTVPWCSGFPFNIGLRHPQ